MKKARGLLTVLLLGTAIAFICVGLLDGEFRRVLAKAAAVCLECIGIG